MSFSLAIEYLGFGFFVNITGHQSLYINFGVFLLIFETFDELGEGCVLCQHKFIEATILCLQCIVRPRFCVEHPLKTLQSAMSNFGLTRLFPRQIPV